MKTFFICVLFVFLSIKSFSQLSHSISLGPELGVPGKTVGNANIGFGASLEYQLKFSAPIGIQLHAGYNQFSNKANSSEKIDFLPLRAGLVGFIYQDLIFASIDAGISRFHSNTTETKKNGFSFGVGLGYKFPVSINQFMQFSAYFNLNRFKSEGSSYVSKYDWFNIRAAYGIAWGKGKKIRDEDE